MGRKTIFFLMATILLVVAVVYLQGTRPVALDPVEIREYEGIDLSSVRDFRENSIRGPQVVDKETYRLEITGLVNQPQTFTYNELLTRQSYEKVVTIDCVEGWSATILWEGILLRNLLDVHSSAANTVIFHAYDGYTTSFPLDYFYENDIIMAYQMNGQPLLPERGFPFQLVAEDKWGYKWIKWITKIELSDDLEYKGYWESRGYANEGNLDENFLEPR